MSDINESKLKNFLQDHQPKAPPPPKDELSRIRAHLPENKSRERSSPFTWFNLGSAIAACLIAVWFLNSFVTNLNEKPVSPSDVKTEEEIMIGSPDTTLKSAEIPMHGTNARTVESSAEDSLPVESETADVDLLEEEWPTMEVGEDYLAWASL